MPTTFKKSIKIALIARKVPPLYGGGGMLARSLAIGLVKYGYDVHLLTDTPAPCSIDKCKILSPYTTEQSTIPFKRLLQRWTEYRWLKQHIKEARYDLVYGISAQAFTLSAIHIAKKSGIPAAFETSLYGNDDYLSVCKLRLGFVFKRFFLSADKIVNISPPLEKACIDGGISHEKLGMIPNPVNEDSFYPVSNTARLKLRNKLGIPESETVLFSAGAVSHRKGYDRLISAFIQVAQQQRACTLVLAGPLPNDTEGLKFTDTLKSALNQANLSNRVIWLGKVDNVNEWMQIANLFIFASRREGFGTVFTEAMSVGLPIVAYSIEGITNYIFDDNCGATIINTEKQFIQSILDLIRDEKKYTEKRKLLLNYYRNSFSADIIFNRYNELFKSLIKKNI